MKYFHLLFVLLVARCAVSETAGSGSGLKRENSSPPPPTPPSKTYSSPKNITEVYLYLYHAYESLECSALEVNRTDPEDEEGEVTCEPEIPNCKETYSLCDFMNKTIIKSTIITKILGKSSLDTFNHLPPNFEDSSSESEDTLNNNKTTATPSGPTTHSNNSISTTTPSGPTTNLNNSISTTTPSGPTTKLTTNSNKSNSATTPSGPPTKLRTNSNNSNSATTPSGPTTKPVTTSNKSNSTISSESHVESNIKPSSDKITNSSSSTVWCVAVGCFVLGAIITIIAKMIFNKYKKKSYVLPPEQHGA